MMPLAPDNRSFYGGDTRSFYGGDNRSGSFYGQPVLDHRASAYSLAGAQPPGFDRSSSYGFNMDAGLRASSYSYGQAPQPHSRPVSNFLPEVNVETQPIGLGAVGITDAQLESSIRRICAGADLDTLTKKGVRKQLEEEYEVSLSARKESINRIIERVLAGECCLRDWKGRR
jgi:chitin synthase